MNLLRQTDVKQILKRSSASTALSTGIDLAGAEGCLFIAHLSSLADGSSRISLKIQGSTVGTTGGFVTYGPSKFAKSTAITTGVKNNKRILMVDLYKPLKRYARAVVAGASSGRMYLNSITAVKYGMRKMGSTSNQNSTTLANSTMLISPTSS